MHWIHLIWAFIFLIFSQQEESPGVTHLADGDLQRLGHELFFDADLSNSGKISCSTCHNPSLAFSDGYRKSVNAYGDQLDKNSPSLLNLSDNNFFNWSHSVTSLFDQLDGPLGNEQPGELSFYKHRDHIIKRLRSKVSYRNILRKYGKVRLDEELIKCALVGYVENLESRNSPFDMYLKGMDQLNSRQLRGKELFFSSKYGCRGCHGGLDFDQFSKSNLMVDDDLLEYGVPTLRNVEITEPYWHDGRTNSLGEAINLHFDYDIVSNEDLGLLISFLEALTDTTYLQHSYFNAPNDTH